MSNRLVGLGSISRTSLRTCSKYTLNRTGLSPGGVPTLLSNGFDVEVPLVYSFVNDCDTQKALH